MLLRGRRSLVRRVGAGGDWRDPFIASGRLLFDWRFGYGEGLVGTHLQTWTDTVSGMVMTAPSAGQRPIPGTIGWLGNPASARALLNAATPALFQATFLTGTSISCVMRCQLQTLPGAGVTWYTVGSASVGTGRYYLRLVDEFGGGIDQYLQKGTYTLPALLAAGAPGYVRSFDYDNAVGGMQGYLDGSPVGVPVPPNVNSVLAQNVAAMFCWTPNGTLVQRPADIDIAEYLIFADTLTDAEHASVSANLFADYP